MKSIWTRVRADTTSPQTGKGEGPAPTAVQPDVKPILTEAASTPEVPSEVRAPAETKPEVPEVKPQALEAKLETTEVKAEVPTSEVKQDAPSANVKSEVQTAEVKNEVTTAEVKEVLNAEVKSEIDPNSEVKVKQPAEVKPEQTESKPVEAVADIAVVNTEAQASQNDWSKREAELLKKIEDLEKAQANAGDEKLRAEIKTREDEVDLLKARVKNLETELQAALSKPGSKNHEMIENIKQQHEELLSKARGMIFDKTKMVKNQELQIEALNTQVQSLKDINLITKDLLEIRNCEVKAMEDRLEAMEAKFKAEKERHGLMLQKAETSSSLNGDLKKEYEMQLGLFKELRVKYEERVQALVAENARLKDLTIALKGDPTPPQ